MPIPTMQQVKPGALVSIVLKADQRTGREVQGTVEELLTKGNHPRGIKVRLKDGRVGRVQRMVSGEAPSGAEADRSGGIDTTPAMQVRREGAGLERVKYRDVRLDDDVSPPSALHNLAMYIKPSQGQKKKKAKTTEGVNQMEGTLHSNSGNGEDGNGAAQASTCVVPLARCPVCGDFEGDEAAVAHHVGEHFTEAPCA